MFSCNRWRTLQAQKINLTEQGMNKEWICTAFGKKEKFFLLIIENAFMSSVTHSHINTTYAWWIEH